MRTRYLVPGHAGAAVGHHVSGSGLHRRGRAADASKNCRSLREAWGWVLGVFTISYGLFEIPTGALGDRFGQRSALTRIVVWWSAFTCFTGVVSNYFLLLLARFLFGAGEAGAIPISRAASAAGSPSAKHARAHGFVWGASRVGGALTPLLVVPTHGSFWAGGRPSSCSALLGVVWAVVWSRLVSRRPGEPSAHHAAGAGRDRAGPATATIAGCRGRACSAARSSG